MTNINDDQINRMRRKSVKPGVHIVFSNRKRIVVRFKTFLIASALATGIMAGGANGLANMIENAKDNWDFNSYVQQFDDVISDENAIYRTGDQLQYHAYSENFIWQEIAMSANPELEMYNVYSRIKNDEIEGYLKEENLDRIIRSVSIYANSDPENEKIQCFAGCKSWDDFLIKQKCVIDGEPSSEMYETYIRMVVDAALKEQELEEKFGVGA